MSKTKWYVVWIGKETGVFSSWEQVQPLVSGYSGAKFKSFPTEEKAAEMFLLGYDKYIESNREVFECTGKNSFL